MNKELEMKELCHYLKNIVLLLESNVNKLIQEIKKKDKEIEQLKNDVQAGLKKENNELVKMNSFLEEKFNSMIGEMSVIKQNTARIEEDFQEVQNKISAYELNVERQSENKGINEEAGDEGVYDLNQDKKK